MTDNLAMTWVTVTDATGQTRLEARWTLAQQSGAPTQATHAA